MAEGRDCRKVSISLLLSTTEWELAKNAFSSSICQYFSEYARKKLLDKPVTFNYRNQSIDDFVTEMITLRNSLDALGKELYLLLIKSQEPGYKLEHRDIETILLKMSIEFSQKVEDIKNGINVLSEVWFQESIPQGKSLRH